MDLERRELINKAGAGIAGALLLALLVVTPSSSQNGSLCGETVDCSSGDLSRYDTLMYDHQGNGNWDDVDLKQFLSKGDGMSISKGVMTWLPQTAPSGHLESAKTVSLLREGPGISVTEGQDPTIAEIGVNPGDFSLSDFGNVALPSSGGLFLQWDGSQWTGGDAYKVKVSGNDTTDEYLNPSITAGNLLTENETNDGGDEQLELNVSDSVATDSELANADDDEVKVTSDDTTSEFLSPSITTGPNLTASPTSGDDEQLEFSAQGLAARDLNNVTAATSDVWPDTAAGSFNLGRSGSPWASVFGSSLVAKTAGGSARTVVQSGDSKFFDANGNSWTFLKSDSSDSAINAAGFERYGIGVEADETSLDQTVYSSAGRSVTVSGLDPEEEPVYQDSSGKQYHLANHDWTKELGPGEFQMITSSECSGVTKTLNNDNSFDPHSISYVETRLTGISNDNCIAGVTAAFTFRGDQFDGVAMHYKVDTSALHINVLQLFRRDSNGQSSLLAEDVGGSSTNDIYRQIGVGAADISGDPVEDGDRLIVRGYVEMTQASPAEFRVNRIEVEGEK